MKKLKFLSLLIISLIFILSCADEQVANTERSKPVLNPDEYNNTKGYWENGEIITKWDCPDAVSFFPPIDIKLWDKTPAVNGRFPTYEETKNGTAIHHYGEKEDPYVKPYNMILPKLAYYDHCVKLSEFDARHTREWTQNDIVVVIQIVQTPKDTIVGFRYLSGGVGGSLFRDFHFLTDEEVKKAVGS